MEVGQQMVNIGAPVCMYMYFCPNGWFSGIYL